MLRRSGWPLPDAREHQFVGPFARYVVRQLVDEALRDRHFPALIVLGRAPTSPWPAIGVTDSAISARLRRRSSRATLSAAISPNRAQIVGEEEDDKAVRHVGAGVVGRVPARTVREAALVREGPDLFFVKDARAWRRVAGSRLGRRRATTACP